MKKFSQVVKEIKESKKNIEIIPTGFPMMDEFLDGGLIKKELVVLGGKTGGGKSMVAGNMFQHAATQGFKCAYFSLEIANTMIVSRLLGSKSNLSPTRIMIKTLETNEVDKMDDADAELSVYDEFMFFYDHLYEYALIEKEIKDRGYDFVVIDFIQNIMTGISDEYARLSTIALSLQKLAKESNCVILALSQLSNAVSRDKREDIVEYKGSGSIGTVCDLGLFIEKGTMENAFAIRLRKNRRGISGVAFNFTIDQPGGHIISMQY